MQVRVDTALPPTSIALATSDQEVYLVNIGTKEQTDAVDTRSPLIPVHLRSLSTPAQRIKS
jgi:hypothetical protein